MKHRMFYLAILLMLLFNSCCKKEKELSQPPAGRYIGEFTYDPPSTWGTDVIQYEIIESNKESLIVVTKDFRGYIDDRGVIYIKDSNKVEGSIPAKDATIPYKLEGEWSKGEKNTYLIKGTFTQTLRKPGGPYIFPGSFEIKSKFKNN